jgi:hypothetical protein
MYERSEYGSFSWVHLCGIYGYIETVDLKSAFLDADKSNITEAHFFILTKFYLKSIEFSVFLF